MIVPTCKPIVKRFLDSEPNDWTKIGLQSFTDSLIPVRTKKPKLEKRTHTSNHDGL